ncbi:unnamed protein product [Cylicocyclus nassatus]|uniref:Uncharacterized protein n=1 Tax=Cylicocyclus nassatus TaxID=53992 RepID=A0AA36GBV5_CYLNA|nr:unnamed protein product [Cylicocyclus nassatus]
MEECHASQVLSRLARTHSTTMFRHELSFQPLLHLTKVCSEAAGAGAVAGDEQFIANLAKEMVSVDLLFLVYGTLYTNLGRNICA